MLDGDSANSQMPWHFSPFVTRNIQDEGNILLSQESYYSKSLTAWPEWKGQN